MENTNISLKITIDTQSSFFNPDVFVIAHKSHHKCVHTPRDRNSRVFPMLLLQSVHMVWLHGGGLVGGTGNTYNPKRLAS